ncbi:MAG: hypothetical protein M0R77_14535 [Gammaproteobacteria bacterium]|nr:hypothetical protein [Gammaproteobacteria bacterium]
MPPLLRVLTSCLLALILSAPAVSASVSREQIKGLDEQVQDIKSEVLGIAAELGRLEEKLLYPSGTQVSLFVSLAKGDTLRLDAVDIRLDGRDVAHHLYTFKELEALQRGGVQRIYTGNITAGVHQLEVSIAGKSGGGNDYRVTTTAPLEKAVGPKLVEIHIAGSGQPGIQVRDW